VALKILPELFALDPDRLARFEREAQVLASLNHPNIAAIYGFEDSNGVQALVMELVEGEDLAQRLARGAIPLEDALPIAKQIADALEAAHEQGIIHRDLKLANVKLRPDGTVKVLDFGLAKALEPTSAVRADPAMSPTITSPVMTGRGVILGTAAYMSPEQAHGRPVDKRADIWAFGCVLFEMLAGRRAFNGDDVTDTLAAIVRDEPEWDALPATLPVAIRRLLRRSLEKDLKRRLADIADARLDIEEVMTEPATSSHAVARGRRVPWAVAVPWILAVTLAGAVSVLLTRTGPTGAAVAKPSVTRIELNAPAGVELVSGATGNAVLSPDGTRVAFVGNVGGLRQLYLRRFDGFDALPMRGTALAQNAFFAPDGGSIGFISSDRTVKKVSLADGLVVTLARDADWTAGGAWGPNDRITFGRNGVLWQVSAS
jgi:eukaryotic-like serine/threonine-protein kinase